MIILKQNEIIVSNVNKLLHGKINKLTKDFKYVIGVLTKLSQPLDITECANVLCLYAPQDW